ncbi:MAG: DUF2577 domain-containing protein [Clostridia bacterium]|nr:DUF2577 domain-containing protein [Clostridia bacterium]
MLNSNDLYNSIKVAAIKAVEASHPCDFLFGKVTSISPLKVYVEQKMTLSSAQLVLTRNVTDYKVDVTIDWGTEATSGGSGESSFASHNHNIEGKKELTIHNGLKVDDEVILLKKKGGQKYLILDKVVTT